MNKRKKQLNIQVTEEQYNKLIEYNKVNFDGALKDTQLLNYILNLTLFPVV